MFQNSHCVHHPFNYVTNIYILVTAVIFVLYCLFSSPSQNDVLVVGPASEPSSLCRPQPLAKRTRGGSRGGDVDMIILREMQRLEGRRAEREEEKEEEEKEDSSFQ